MFCFLIRVNFVWFSFNKILFLYLFMSSFYLCSMFAVH